MPSLKSMKICKTALFLKNADDFSSGKSRVAKSSFFLEKKPPDDGLSKNLSNPRSRKVGGYFLGKFGIKKGESGKRGRASTESQFSVLSFFSLLFFLPPQEHRTKNDFWKQTSISFYQFFFSFSSPPPSLVLKLDFRNWSRILFSIRICLRTMLRQVAVKNAECDNLRKGFAYILYPDQHSVSFPLVIDGRNVSFRHFVKVTKFTSLRQKQKTLTA